jgi:hypothetical protein
MITALELASLCKAKNRPCDFIRKEEGNKLREKYTIPIPNEYKNKIELWK